jgi:CHASE3 domain sensor protein
MLEGTMISLGVAAAGVVATFSVLKSKVTDSIERDKEQDKRFEEYQQHQSKKIHSLEAFMNEKAPLLDHLSKSENAIFNKLDNYGKDIVALQQKVGQAPTMKEVRDEFVTKEMYLQMKEHIDEKFSKLELGLVDILKELRSK